MAGKAYQLKEMKGIVDYVVEHKRYSETKGRKMWMDFANSSATTRTWQSLKETFLKRILPDIHNPYYKLTRDQTCSFQQGCDVQAKEKNNRLEIRSASPEPNKKAADNQTDQDQASTSNKNGNEVEKAPGMDIKHAKITSRNRSSADTLILEGDAENNDDENEKIRQKNEELIESAKAVLGDIDETSKSLKDCLEFEYTDPAMTPIVREVINDFETESEGSDNEPQMQIVEAVYAADTTENVVNIQADDNEDTNASDLIIIEDTENMDGVEESTNAKDKVSNEEGHEVEVGPVLEEEVITESINDWLKDCAQQDNPKDNPETNLVNENGGENELQTQSESEKVDEPITIDSENTAEIIDRTKEGDQKTPDNEDKNKNSLSTTADTIIPNNQEVLDENITKSQNKSNPSPDVSAISKDTATRKRSISQDNNESKKQKVNDDKETRKEDEPKTNGEASVIEINSVITIDTEETSNAQNKETVVVVEDSQPCTSKQAKLMDIKMLAKNPCLQSVSLFEEQFNTTKYSDSDGETPITNNKEKDKPTQETQAKLTAKENDKEPTLQTKAIIPTKKVETTVGKKEVIVLKTESDSDETWQVPQKEPEKLTLRYKHLSKAFGFAAGPSVSTQRRRSLRCRTRKSKSQRNSFTMRSDSSQWETGSASDAYVSPPRGRRNKQGRKYLKPASARIIPLDEEGGVVVVHRNKIYPLVKDGRNIKTYVTYDAGSGSEEEDNNYWRQKYVEEKKKAAELQKQLNQAQAQAQPGTSRSPILQGNTRRNACSSVSNVQAPSELNINNKMDITQVGSSGKIQITLSKSNEQAINLEGHWPQVLPIVQQVMSIFYKNNDQETKQMESCNMLAVNQQDAKVPTSDQNAQNQIDSGQTTPIIPVIDLSAPNKVEELENAIFKEIEEIDRANAQNTVTKRKVGRPKKTPSTSSDQSEPAKKQRKSKIKPQDKTQLTETPQTNGKPPDTGSESSKTTRSKAKRGSALEKPEVMEATEDKITEDKVKESETIKSIEPPVTRTQTRKSGKSGNETDSSTRTTRLSAKRAEGSDDETRYMLPPEPKRKSTAKKAGSSGKPHEISQDRSTLSVDSMQGYQDSDASPVTINTKRKRKVSLTVRKGKLVTRRKSTPSIQDISLDSSNSSYFVPIKKSQVTLDSAVYKTESYQLLMPTRKISVTKLDAIDETSAVSNDLKHFNAVSNSSDASNILIEIGSSSNVSLPQSPELSVVENLSISREIIQDKNNPTINEMQANDSIVRNIYNQYLMSDIDVSVPLMQQECELLNSSKDETNEPKPQEESQTISAGTMNNDLSASLDARLRELLLESAKKMTVTDKENVRSQPMEVDESKAETAKKKGKKRCSTPQKRNTKKTKVVVNPVIEEHMEYCFRGGRVSCPPVITFIPLDENANNSSDVQLTKIPRKKNIIKVKITRPKSQKSSNKNRIEKKKNTSRASVYTDSGINETASISGALEGSSEMDLIHNHSETCVHANECVCDSIELVDSTNSIISLNSTASLEDELLKLMDDVEKLSGNHRTRVAQEIANKSAEDVYLTPTETVYHSPVASNTSILTEDLSDEVQNDSQTPPTKWYLLTEDETNTNSRPEPTTSKITQFTSNLKQLFPITCAVPDLSTISEMSKENEDSRKTGLEDDDTQGSDYQSLI